jgi:HPt (histidine-containing phosphotransfer) domain-containing protein
VALTGSKLDEDVERCLRAGMDAHLAKPVALQALRATIRTVLIGDAPAESAPPEAPHEAVGDGAFRPEQALATLAGHRELLAEVTRSVVAQSPRVLREAQTALRDEDLDALESTAHRLKSMLRLVAAEPSARAAEHLEGLAREGRLADCEPTLAALEAEVRRLLDALRQSLRSG